MHPRCQSLLLAFSLGTLLASSHGAVTLPGVISDHAVLKASPTTRLWGKAEPGEKVSVSIAGKIAEAQAAPDGRWQVALDLQKSGPGPFELVVKGTNEIKISDVLVGEVWLASGQSNMDFSLKQALDAEKIIPQSANPQMRFFKIGLLSTPLAKDDARGSWVLVGPETAGNLSAVAYFFAREVQGALQQPVGVIQTSWGGSSVEGWISPASLNSVPDLKNGSELLWKQSEAATVGKEVFNREFPAWLKTTGREDHPPADPASYAAPDISTVDWVPVKISSPIAGEGLPATGAIWLRCEFDVPANAAGKRAVLRAAMFDGIEKLYLNGKFLREKKLPEYVGPSQIYYDIPAGSLLVGRNVIALRVFAPIASPSFTGTPPAIDAIKIQENWIAKAEYALPDPVGLPPAPPFPPVGPAANQTPGYLYNGMIAPFLPATLSGFIWYQGETNTDRAWQYRTAFSLLITDWRSQFAQGDLPFYFCQLANFKSKVAQPVENDWAEIREAQSFVLKLSNTGQAVTIDLGESDDIHYLEKAPAGHRLATLALNRTYKKQDVVASGPIYLEQTIEGDHLRLRFSEVGGGLVAQPLPATYLINRLRDETAPLVRNSPNSELEGFQICGSDHKWVWADAKIDGPGVLVSSPNVPAPVAARYGWSANPTLNLYNAAGLPASPFRTDDFPLTTVDRKL